MRYAQLVCGPAGSGKSTYCAALTAHAQDAKRNISVVNLDPAAEYFSYQTMADIRDLIQVDDVMEDEDIPDTDMSVLKDDGIADIGTGVDSCDAWDFDGELVSGPWDN